MRQSLFLVIALLFSVMLTACGGGAAGGGSDGAADIVASIGDLKTVAGSPKPAIPVDDMGNEYITITDVSDGETEEDVTLSGLAFLKNNAHTYERKDGEAWGNEADDSEITLSSITAPVVTLSFDAAGDISQVVAYVDKEYTVAATSSSGTRFTGTENGVTIIAERGTGFFGFDSNYMAYVGWSLRETLSTDATILEDTINDIDGIMLAGVETSNLNNISGSITFTGKGQGIYGDEDNSYKTIFDVTAAVNFTARTIGLSTTTTSCANSCGDIVASDLNFALTAENETALSFANEDETGSVNNISSNVIEVGDFEGRLDARFYGAAAQEFGGTFALKDGKEYYYGAFGAVRGEADTLFAPAKVITISALNTVNVSGAHSVDTPSASLTLSATNNEMVTLQGLAVAHKDIADYARATTATAWTDTAKLNIDGTITPSRITASAVSFTFFNGDGTISGVTAYADENYTDATVDRSTIFGFASDYMAYISWNSSQDVSDLDSSATTDTLTNISGMMLAGIETTASNIFNDGKAKFTGKGSGIYGTKTGSFNTNFTATAEIDFSDNSVELTTDTVCVDCGNFDATILNFTNLELGFADGNIISEDVTLDSTLAGKLDVRFYGDKAQEFGGAFALAQADTRYYYGAFGATRGGVTPFVASDTTTINAVNTDLAANMQATDTQGNHSLSTINDNNVTLQGLTVLLKNVIGYTRYTITDTAWTDTAELKIDRQITPTPITSSAVSLAFDANNVASVTTIFADTNYISGNTDAIDIDRISIFDFAGGNASNYMAYISWNSSQIVSDLDASATTDTLNDIDGMMIAGIETLNVTNLAADGVMFMGKGSGTYGDEDSSYGTVFDITATVNFVASKNVTIESSNTQNATDNSDVSSILDFTTAALTYTDTDITLADTVIGGDVALKSNANFKGALDARFYGTRAWEFGGTFALADSDNYYFGAFGAERGGIDASLELNAVTTPVTLANDVVASIAGNNHQSLDAASMVVGGTTIFMNALMVHKNDTTHYSRAPNRDWATQSDTAQTITLTGLTGAGASLSFDAGGKISEVTAYVTGNDYTIDDFTSATGLSASSNEAGNSDLIGIKSADSTMFNVERGMAFFNFDSNYMVYINGISNRAVNEQKIGLTQNSYDVGAYMIAGIETLDFSAISADGVMFTGKGSGTYGDENDSYDTVFDITATVNFVASKDVTIESSNTQNATDNSDVSSILDFTTAALTYTDTDITLADTVIGGDVALKSNANFKGALDVRFYGARVWEFGGTFALADSDSYYYGAFGAERISYINTFTITPAIGSEAASNSVIATPIVAEMNDSLTLVAAAGDGTGFIMDGTSFYQDDSIIYHRAPNRDWATKSDRAQTITLAKLTASGASLTFDSGNDISSVTVYAHDKNYTDTSGANASTSNKFDGSVIDVDRKSIFSLIDDKGTVDTSDDVAVTSNYMAYVSWGEDKSLDTNNATLMQTVTDIDGMMIAGIETNNANIPTESTIWFNGKGSGFYRSKTESYDTIFNLTVAVDFANTNILSIASAKTCKDITNVNCGNNSNQRVDTLNFTTSTGGASINYIGVNNISSGVKASDLLGTLDARFYGTRAREFGGTFALTDSATNRYYYGAFGAERGGIDTLTSAASIDVETLLAVDRSVGIPFGVSSDSLEDSKANHDMNSLAVYQDDTNDYSRASNRSWGSADNDQNTEIVRVTNSIGRVQFDNMTGNIKEISVYLSGVNYSTIVLSHDSSVRLSASNINRRGVLVDGYDPMSPNNHGMLLNQPINADFDATIATIEADRSSDFFGFDTSYMAYIGWHIAKQESDLNADGTVLTDSISNQEGMMLAGIETVDILTTAANIGTAVAFAGKGHGTYGDATTSYKTIFDTTATVNFADGNVTIESSNTLNASDNSDVSGILDFTTAALTYTDTDIALADTVISGDVALKNDADFKGTLDARFYGTIGQEFGGTFALIDADSDSYYYGIFGVERTINTSASIMDNASATVTSPDAEVVNSTYETITAGADANLSYTLKALSVYGKVTDNHTRLSTDDLWKYSDIERSTTVTTVAEARIVLTHINNKQLGAFTLNPDNAITHASGTNIDADGYILEAPITSPPDYTSTVIEGYRGNEFFGFDSENMVYARWNITQTAINLDERDVAEGASSSITDNSGISNGVMIAGLETANGDIPDPALDNIVKFIGKGRGFYSNADTNIDYQTIFRVRADVTFGASSGTVTINSYDTCKADDCANTALSALDFSATALSFANVNNITGTATTASGLTGTLDARFYGKTGTDGDGIAYDHAAEELGGTFALLGTDNGVTNESYYGAFGATAKFHIVADTTNFAKWSDTTERTMNGLGYTIAASDGPLTQTFNITQTGGQISAVIINTLNVAGATSNTQTFAQSLKDGNYGHISDDTANIETTVFSSHKGVMRFIHKDNTNATGNRITVVHEPDSNKPWSWEYQTVGIIDDGTAKGGFSTGAFTNDIPTNGNSNFEGYVFGYYKNGDDGYLTRATATVAVDFAEGTANITTSATKRITPPTIEASGNGTAVGGSSFKNASTDNSLNFTGTLRYQELYKWFRGDVSTTDGTTLTSGDATMKAYGPNAEEVGGVFRLQNSDGTKTYAGAFGAKE